MAKNAARRKRVMQRSIRLGHCVCDPGQPCPCDLFREQDICLCAGERLESPQGPVALTRQVEKAGCASKIDQAFLKATLGALPTFDDPRVLVGMPAGDDAGVYDVGGGMALVQTVDVFTPSVDDPYAFGQVAAANSLSDVYAMGGRPITALSIVGFPVRKLPDEVLTQILRGGIDTMKEAGVPVVGGHSINDDQIKAGFAVTGMIATDKIITNAKARPGDDLILTKPLGTGIVAFAKQIERASLASIAAAERSMTTLNKSGAELMVQHGAHACTDVTGFSLMGHLSEMALRSQVTLDVVWDALPWFPDVLQYVADGILPGAVERNRESCGMHVTAGSGVSDPMEDMCFDAQTSGGLLIAVDPTRSADLLADLHQAGMRDATVIGSVTGTGMGTVHLTTRGKHRLPEPTAPVSIPTEKPTAAEPPVPLSTEANTETQYRAFLSQVTRPGHLDVVTKQAIQISLAVAQRSATALKASVKQARERGFTQAEIDEAAWLGIGFGGEPARLFYQQGPGAEE